MRTLLIFLTLLSNLSLESQPTSQIVIANQFCVYNSVIFKDVNVLNNISDKVLDTDENSILIFEKALDDFLNFVIAKKSFKKYRRQYATIVLEGEDYLFVNMVNFGNKFIRKTHSVDFNNNLVLGLGEIYEKNTFSLIYNLKNGGIRFF